MISNKTDRGEGKGARKGAGQQQWEEQIANNLGQGNY
jgi:hypothetical protein